MAKLEAETSRAELVGSASQLDHGPMNGLVASPRNFQSEVISGLANQAQIEGVGVYQGTKTSPGLTINGRSAGFVDILIRRTAKPVVLILAAYEPIQWRLKVDSGAKLAAVLLSGYYQSEVIGAGSARVIVGGRSYAYDSQSSEFRTLDQHVIALTGKRINVFQGRYEGRSFAVGG